MMNKIYEKVRFYKDRDVIVHISMQNKTVHNGKIIEIRPDFIIFKDIKTGEMPIFFIEIFDIEPYIKIKGDKNGCP